MNTLRMFVSAEAYFESFPQLALQVHTILNGHKVSTVQVVSMLFSLVTLTKTAIFGDIEKSCYIHDVAHKVLTFKFRPMSLKHNQCLTKVPFLNFQANKKMKWNEIANKMVIPCRLENMICKI